MSREFPEEDIAAGEPQPLPTGPRKAVEEWARARGLYPQTLDQPVMALPGVAPGQLGTVAVRMGGLRAPRHNPEYWRFAAAKAMHGWPIGAEVSEQEFDEAIAAATSATAR